MSMTWRTRLIWISAGLGLGLAIREYRKRLHMLDLRDKVVLITGSSRGLGLALAREFAQQGAQLVICARQREPLEAARQELEAMGSRVLAVPCDITQWEQVQGLIQQAQERFGRIDIVVNNAGVITVGPQQTMTLEDYEEAMKSMYWGMVYTTQAVLPQMRARKSGHIVNITSIGGKLGVPHLLPYCSAKFAALGFSEGLHAEVSKDGIKVVTVVPGLMRTGSHINAFFKGQQQIEYTLFGLLATLPFTSMQASQAAHQIVQATRRGDTEIILTIQAQLAARFHGLLPGLTTDLLSLVDRLLPDANPAETLRSTGRMSRSQVSRTLTGLGERPAHEYHQYLSKEEPMMQPSGQTGQE
jgi:NAD(P)-dependent dehydrogenase (short-subunit alcohol dehydrogenase family)